MSKLTHRIAVAALAAASACPALAASPDGAPARAPSEAQSRQQGRMASCNQQAAGQKGDARKAFMKACLSAAKAGAPAERTPAGRTAPR